MRTGNPFIVVDGRSVPVRGGRGRRSAPEAKGKKGSDMSYSTTLTPPLGSDPPDSKAPFYEDYLFADNAPTFHYDYLGLSIMNPFKVGQVKFENCSECQLKTFRLIPENYKNGEELKEPGSGWNSSVDGVWVEGVQEWLKIPDHCYVTIICLDGCDFEYRWKCNALFSWIQKMRGKVSEVGFVPDQGETKHSTDYPF